MEPIEEIKTMGDLNKYLPKWIDELCAKKNLKYWKPKYLSWDWYSSGSGRQLVIKLRIDFPQGGYQIVELCVTNGLFKEEGLEIIDFDAHLADKAKYGLAFLVKYRLLYLIYIATKWIIENPEYDPKKSTKFRGGTFIMTVDDYGHVNYEATEA